MKYGVPPSGGGAHANTMTAKTFNTLNMANGLPATAGTPNLPPHGVPPSGGRAHANKMTLKTFDTLDMTDASPAKAGTPNLRAAPHGVPLYGVPALAGQGMKELEGMLK